MERLSEMLLGEGLAGRIVSTAVLTSLLKGGDARRWGLVNRALRAGELVRLKRGLYTIAPDIAGKSPELFTIANRIVPESYVSMESALGYHGWLQEEPIAVHSCIPRGRDNSFVNPFGRFVYKRVPFGENRFLLGVERHSSERDPFLIAGPERALADTLFARKMEWKGINALEAQLRIDPGLLGELDLDVMKEIATGSRSRSLGNYVSSLLFSLGGRT